jgi:hypothetical protein
MSSRYAFEDLECRVVSEALVETITLYTFMMFWMVAPIGFSERPGMLRT